MDKFLLGFIGTGHMGGALARAAVRSTPPEQVALANRSPEKAAALAAELGCRAVTPEEAARDSKYILLGVKPQMMGDLMRQIVPSLRTRRDRFILVTMAAGLSIERIQQLSNGEYPVMRICPNTPVSVGKGLVAWCAEGAAREETDEFISAMSGAGRWDECSESLMDAASVLGGCTPAFAYMFIEALSDGAVRCGLPRDKALLYAAQAVEGAAALAQNGEHPGALKDAVCSPGGSTIAGVNALEDRAFRGAVMDAVSAAFRRTTEMGR